MSNFRTAAIAAVSLLVTGTNAICESYGVDFQNGGTYFQNASSTANFDFVQYFEGCEQDVSSNIFVDPQGNQYQCTKTPLTPSDTNQLSTCPITKDHLYSGDWSIIIASNNGNGAPIAYERDFSLIVGIPTTITLTPTVIVTTTSTPISTKTFTTSTTATTTGTKTVTSPSVTLKPTTTITPSSVTSTKYVTTSVFTYKAITVQPLITTVTRTKTCSIAPSQKYPDPTASIAVKSVNRRDAVKFDLAGLETDKKAWLVARRERLAEAHKYERRGLDKASTTVTETNSASFKTSTSTVPATMTITLSTTIEATVFSTVFTTTTVLKGTTTLKQQTVTAPTPTSTKTKSVLGFTTSTFTVSPLITLTIATAPASATAACKSAGGKLI